MSRERVNLCRNKYSEMNKTNENPETFDNKSQTTEKMVA